MALVERTLYDRDPREKPILVLAEELGSSPLRKIQRIRGFNDQIILIDSKCLLDNLTHTYLPSVENRLVYLIGECAIIMSRHISEGYPEVFSTPLPTIGARINSTKATIYSGNDDFVNRAVGILRSQGFREYELNTQAHQLPVAVGAR